MTNILNALQATLEGQHFDLSRQQTLKYHITLEPKFFDITKASF